MQTTQLKPIIAVLAAATGLIHLYLNVRSGRFDPAFTLNGIGFIALIVPLFWQPAFLKPWLKFHPWVFIAFTTLTIILWVVLGDASDGLAWVTKTIELSLIVALFVYARSRR